MTRDTRIVCDRYQRMRGPHPLCSFTMWREAYGDAIAIKGTCNAHGGQIRVVVEIGPPPKRKSQVVRDKNYRADLRLEER